MKFLCIADEETVRGFRLAGIAGEVAASTEQAAAALDRAVRADCGIIIMTDKVAATIRDRVETHRLKRDRPLIAEIPGPDGPLAGRKTLRAFVQEAVGMQVG